MLVFVSHAGPQHFAPGNFGVTVFFFLSGYLITTLLRMEFEATGRISLRAFYLRRVLRIFPPFYLVLLIASLLAFAGALGGPPLRLDALLSQVFHLSNYHMIAFGWGDGRAPGTGLYWSLAVEEHFYLAFPLLYLVLLRVASRRRQMLVMLGICGAVLIWRCVLVLLLHSSQDRTYIATDTRIDSILFGCALAVWGNPALDPSRIATRWWKWGLFPLGVAAILLTFVVRSHEFEETFRYSLQGLALFPIFILAIRTPEWGPFKLLNLRWVTFVGVLSYSIYLMHQSIIVGIQRWIDIPWVLQGIIALAIVVLAATAIHYLVEKPCARLRRRLSRVEPSRSNEAAAPQVLVQSTPAGGALDASSPRPGMGRLARSNSP
jgi:peptidoglycan/LPS O-acetylase OafA/YrhL